MKIIVFLFFLINFNAFAEKYITDLEVMAIDNKNYIKKLLNDQIKIEKKGNIDDVYFSLGVNIYDKDSKVKKNNVLIILNNRGEIIWHHVLNKGRVNKSDRYLFHKIYDNKIFVFFRYMMDNMKKEKAFLEIIDIKTKESIIQDVSKLKPHHDFLIKEDSIYFLRKKTKTIRQLNMKNQKVKGDVIIKYNFKKEKAEIVWDSFKDVFPDLGRKFDDKDFTHANSLDFQNNQWVISLRNENLIILLDKKFELIKKYKGDELDFFWQHNVQFYKDGFLLFNNNKEKVSYVEIRDSQMNKIKQSVLKYGDFHSPIRSSVENIDNKFYSLFVGEKQVGKSLIVQFDNLLKEEGRLEIYHNDGGLNFYRIS